MDRRFAKWLFSLFFALFLFPLCVMAQRDAFVVSGEVCDTESKEALMYALIEVRSATDSTIVASAVATEGGRYQLSLDSPGEYLLRATFVGYKSGKYQKIEIVEGKSQYVCSFELEAEMTELHEVIVAGLSQQERVARLAYNVSMLETGKLKNTTLDLAHMLDKISGVKIRETGGLGSDVNISLNGFSGRHVKVFIDGVPMEGMSSAFGLNNIPVGLARRIEVYKGVVPIELGGDALGGAINIVTDESRRTRVSASYSYGSFNTHKSSVFAEYLAQSGFYASLNAYQNYSDNNYKVNARILDLETQLYQEGTRRVERFHGMYHNEAVVAKIGVMDKPWADRLVAGFVGGYEYQEVQNASSMDFVFGRRYNTATTLMPSLAYVKRFPLLAGLRVSLNGNYNFGKSFSADTSSRTYNWLGEYKTKDMKGELSYMKYHYRDRNGAANLLVVFLPATNHSLSLSGTFTAFSRKGHDEVNPQESDNYPRKSMKNVSGLSYKFDYRETWNTSIFVKNYLNRVEAYLDPEGGANYQYYQATNSYWGGGIASTYFWGRHVQVKFSYEHAYRLPTSKELFGSGDGIEIGTSDLKPEASDNLNAGVTVAPVNKNEHYLSLSASFQYRNVQDYIRRTVSQTKGTATSTNEGKVRSVGMDVETRYTYKDLFFVGGNFSYFNMRNMTRYKSGTTVESTIYKDRIPNQPWMYGNAEAGASIRNVGKKGTLLDIHYMMSYVHEFYFDWPSYNGKRIPRQFSHDIYLSYSMEGKHAFTVGVECRNLLDEELFDNYNLQKPGRSFAVKVSYNFSK